MPNSEKLTPFERGAYSFLPKVAPIAKTLEWINKTPVGKALQYLDVLAEGTERALGYGYQVATLKPEDEWDAKAAWNAGTMFYDTLNLPHLQKDADGKYRLDIPYDLPGPAALAEMRRKLATGGDIESVKEEYYNGLGALALRSQIQDTWGHIVLDPLSYILPHLKLVEKSKAVATFATLNKYDINDIVKLEEAARKVGNIKKADELLGVIGKIEKGELPGYDTIDRLTVALHGEDLSKPDNILQRTILKPLQLTPESRASEMTTMVADHYMSYIGNPHWADPEGTVKALGGVAKGATGQSWGHAMLTKVGRAVQAQSAEIYARSQSKLLAWKSLAKERNDFVKLASAIGEKPRDLLRLATTDPAVVSQRLLKNGVQMPAPEIERLAGTLKGSVLDPEEFSADILKTVQDVTMQQAIVQFGVKARGPVNRWTNVLKSIQSIPFIKLNPTNLVRNIVGNDVTMAARGGFGTMLTSAIHDFWKGEGGIPVRFTQGFNLGAGDEFASDAGKLLREALYPKKGVPEKITEYLDKFQGLSGLSAKAEKAASLRSATVGYLEGVNNYQFTSVKNSLSPDVLDELEKTVPGITDDLDNILKSAQGNTRRFRENLFKELEYNPQKAFDGASDILGNKVDDFLDTETAARITQGLPDAIRNKRVPEFMAEIRADMESHLDDMFERSVRDLTDNVANQVVAGGPQQIYRNLGNAVDELWGAHTEDAIRMGQLNDSIRTAREAKDWDLLDVLWSKVRSDRDKYFTRMWNKFDAYLKGMEKGAKKAGIQMSPELRPVFRKIKGGWQDFHKFKRDEWNAFFEAVRSKKPSKTYEEIQAAVSARYHAMADFENDAMQKVDDLLAAGMPPQQAQIFKDYRNIVAQLRKADKEAISQFWDELARVPIEERAPIFRDYWQGVIDRRGQMRELDRIGSSAMQGDRQAVEIIGQAGQSTRAAEEVADEASALSKEPTLDPSAGGQAAVPGVDYNARGFIPDVHELGGKGQGVIPDIQPLDSMTNMFSYGRQYSALDAIEESASNLTGKATFLKSIPKKFQDDIMKWARKVETDELPAARYFATRMGEFKRDASLLNYNRRSNFDAWLGNMVPFGFWTTHSALNWAVHSLDRPAMLTTYLRMRNFLESAGLEDENAPSRLRRNIRINLPFVPDWMGSQFVDPLRLVLPFDSWLSPFEQNQNRLMKADGRAERVLDSLLQSGTISQEAYMDAKQNHAGSAWDMAMEKVEMEDPEMKFDAFDFGTMLMSPHAPLVWAYNIARGQEQDIGPFTPMARTFRDVATLLGVKDWNNSPMNLEGKIRKQLGLPAFDKWDDYRTDRMLASMAADAVAGRNDFTLDEINRAMVDRSGPVYEEAVSRANQEFTGGPGGAILRLLGIPVKSYPEGEQDQRALQDDFARAFEAYDNGDTDALRDFFDEHPEYETRLATWDKPEERMRKFLIDQVWSQYNSFPQVNRNELREQLGSVFSEKFLDKETRALDSISPEEMQVWIKLMGGDPVGTMSAEQKTLAALFSPELTPPETAWRTQVFYDERKERFPNYAEMQNLYYAQPEKSRRASPELKAYWSWRRQFMYNNPDLVPYLTDNERDIEKAQRRERTEQAVPNAQEIQMNLSPAMQALLQEGGELPYVVERQLEIIAEQNGMTVEQIKNILGVE